MSGSSREILNSKVVINNSLSSVKPPEESVYSVVRLAPLAGVFLSHNTTQSLLLGKAVTYFAHPLANYFLNLPIAAAVGSITYAVTNLVFNGSEKEKVSIDCEAVIKSIAWSAVFTAIGAIGLQKAVVESSSVDAVSRVFLATAGNILGPSFVEMGFAIASTALSVALISLFEEDSKKS